MEFMKTIRGFHWVTQMAIALTAFILALLLIAFIAAMFGQNDIANGLGPFVGFLAADSMYFLILILVLIALAMVISRIKQWIEKYLDAMLSGLDTLTTQNARQDKAGAAIAILNDNIERMEKKLDHIEHILEKVGD